MKNNDIIMIKKYCEKELIKLNNENGSFEKGLIHAYNRILHKIELILKRSGNNDV